jgi:serine/threonine protein kinase
VIVYRVTIGPFVTDVVMLNLNYRTQTHSRKVVSQGNFGEVIEIFDGHSTYVAKRVFFKDHEQILSYSSDMISWEIRANFSEIQDVLIEYAFNKICAALRIGPQVKPELNFDVVCYEDAIQFYMEKCEPINVKGFFSIDTFERRMLYCLRLMHSLNLIHKDIKPHNICFSISLNDFVFIDFGVSTYIS